MKDTASTDLCVVTVPELSYTDRGEGHYQASLAEVICGVKSLLTQACQTCSQMWLLEWPTAKVEKVWGKEAGMSCPWC